jgi:hypothetical protein
MQQGGTMRIHRHTILIGAVLAMWLTAGTAWASSFVDISAQELKAKMDSDRTLFVLNPLSDIEFNEGHIPGSMNIPLHMIPDTDQLPADKDTPIVTYCLGPK